VASFLKKLFNPERPSGSGTGTFIYPDKEIRGTTQFLGKTIMRDNPDKFTGSWKDGKRYGRGVFCGYVEAIGQFTFEGEYIDDKPVSGILTNHSEGWIYKGKIVPSDRESDYPFSAELSGPCEVTWIDHPHNRRVGSVGCVWQGEFHRNKVHPSKPCVKTYPDGTRYINLTLHFYSNLAFYYHVSSLSYLLFSTEYMRLQIRRVLCWGFQIFQRSHCLP
jgi:hypothetical protein